MVNTSREPSANIDHIETEFWNAGIKVAGFNVCSGPNTTPLLDTERKGTLSPLTSGSRV